MQLLTCVLHVSYILDVFSHNALFSLLNKKKSLTLQPILVILRPEQRQELQLIIELHSHRCPRPNGVSIRRTEPDGDWYI